MRTLQAIVFVLVVGGVAAGTVGCVLEDGTPAVASRASAVGGDSYGCSVSCQNDPDISCSASGQGARCRVLDLGDTLECTGDDGTSTVSCY